MNIQKKINNPNTAIDNSQTAVTVSSTVTKLEINMYYLTVHLNASSFNNYILVRNTE